MTVQNASKKRMTPTIGLELFTRSNCDTIICQIHLYQHGIILAEDKIKYFLDKCAFADGFTYKIKSFKSTNVLALTGDHKE